MYNVLNFCGLVAGDTPSLGPANQAALEGLVNTVIAAGGGTVYFPAGTYHFHTKKAPDKYVLRLTTPEARLRFVGDGKASRLIWNRDDGSGGDAHFFRFEDGFSQCVVEHLYFVQGTLTNPDGAEQHHAFRLAAANTANSSGNVEHIHFLNCHFGVFKGDAINCSGGFLNTKCHARNIAANNPAGAIPGPYTNPARPQRVSVQYPASWDGGSITVSGTNLNGGAIEETIPAAVNDTIVGEKEFATVTGATKSAQGVTAGLAAIGYGYMVRHVIIRDCTFNGFEYGAADPGYGYRSAVGVQRMSSGYILGCRMTGSNDQLIDFEPTGNGNLGPWIIDGNYFNPQGTAKLVVTLSGNGQTLQNEYSSFSRNIVVNGRVSGLKTKHLRFVGNIILGPENETDAPVGLSETQEDLDVSDNLIVVAPGGDTALRLNMNGGASNTRGVRVRNNTLFWRSGGAGLRVTGGNSVEIRGNRLIYLGADSNAFTAIIFAASVVKPERVTIEGNVIEGDRGGGTLQYGIDYQPGSFPNSNITIANNSGTGITSRGVTLPKPSGGGSYATTVRVHGNDFPGAETPIFLGPGVVIAVAGNAGSWSMYRGIAVDPNATSALDSVELGSLYSGANGNVYMKTAAGSSGWKTITHA
jgi:hypothetical protein